jgi:glycosyltransferase involved in cell wall biosynthesis
MCAARILINANIDSFARQRGVARYYKEVTAGLIAAFGDQTIVLSPEAGNYAPARHIRSVSFRGSRRFRIRDAFASLIAAYENVDVVFNPYYGRLWTTAPSIFTVYDMISELLPHHANRGTRLFVAEKKRCFEQADVLVAISHSTAQDIVTCYPLLTSAKIVVTQLG